MKLITIFGGFRGLNSSSYQISEATFEEAIFPYLLFLYCSKDPWSSRNMNMNLHNKFKSYSDFQSIGPLGRCFL